MFNEFLKSSCSDLCMFKYKTKVWTIPLSLLVGFRIRSFAKGSLLKILLKSFIGVHSTRVASLIGPVVVACGEEI